MEALIFIGLIGVIIYISGIKGKVRFLEKNFYALKEKVNFLERELEKYKSKGEEGVKIEKKAEIPPIILKETKAEQAKMSEAEMSGSETLKLEKDIKKPLPAEPLKPQEIFTPSRPAAQPAVEQPAFDWENFLSVKLFAWLGGFALFLGAMFLVKYSLDNNLISYEMRIILGLLLGIGVIIGGIFLQKKEYGYTSQTLCGAGIAILYGDIFAAHALYNFISVYPTFGIMVLITVAACLLAVRFNYKFIALLGLLGGFLTPILISTGVDNPLGLFGYILILDCGLATVAYNKRWNFLVSSAGIATTIMQVLWVSKYFAPEKIYICLGVFLMFSALFMLIAFVNDKKEQADDLTKFTGALIPLFSLIFTFYLFGFSSIIVRPGLVFSYIFLLDAGITALAVFKKEKYYIFHLIAGILSFILLFIWTITYLNQSLLLWALAFYFLFALLYAIIPIILMRLYPKSEVSNLSYIFPLVIIALIFIPLLEFDVITFLIWPFLLLINLIIVFMTWMARKFWPCIISLFFSWIAVTIFAFTITITSLLPLLAVILLFTAAFFVLGLFFGRDKNRFTDLEITNEFNPVYLSVITAFIPFFLMAVVNAKLPLGVPNNVYGMTAVLGILLLYLAQKDVNDYIPIAALGGTVFVEYSWHLSHYQPDYFILSFVWYGIFYLAYLFFPFIFKKKFENKIIPWGVSVASGVLHFYLFYNAIDVNFGNGFIGVLPALLAIITLPCLYSLIKIKHLDENIRNTQLAFFGGIVLLFITMIIPLQLDKEWITISWALEGLALSWLLTRIPHNGLKIWATGLFITCFARLALNPAVLSYHSKSAVAIINWYLYTYGTVAGSMFFASNIVPDRFAKIEEIDLRQLLKIFGAVLLFLLLNIEIADYYSTGTTLTFKFSGNFAMDMTYSLGWLIFSLIIMVYGMAKKSHGARIGGILLLIITIIKVFLHDLWRMGQLYRIASIIGLAVTLILVSFLYQKFLKSKASQERQVKKDA